MFTCIYLYGIAEVANAVAVPGSDHDRVHLAAQQPGEHVGCLVCGVVGSNCAVFLEVGEVADATSGT